MKKNLNLVTIIIIIGLAVFSGCKKSSDNPTPAAFVHTIGESYGGGLIAYILQPGDPGYNDTVQHGLIVAPSDQSTGEQWGCNGTLIGAYGIALGTGQANTDSIVSHCGTGTAAYLCHILTLGGYSDWYLPSIGELDKLYIFNVNHPAIAGFASAFYWSSSELINFTVWFEDFSSGTTFYTNWNSTYYVRAVRVF